MKKNEIRDLKDLLININSYSHLFKGINLTKEIQGVNVNFYYEDKNSIERNINEIIFTDSSRLVFYTYDEMLNYLKGMSDLVDMIKVKNKYD